MIQKKRLVQEKRNRAPRQRRERVFDPLPLLDLGTLAAARKELRVDADEPPAAGFERPALFPEVPHETRATLVVYALRHLSEQHVVANVVIARQVAARHGQLADFGAGKRVIRL